jgi:hypothetical protein
VSLYVVEKEEYNDREFLDRMMFGYSYRPMTLTVPEIRDCNARDGEWHVVITMEYETVEWEGYAVPAFEGDVERIQWTRSRSRY